MNRDYRTSNPYIWITSAQPNLDSTKDYIKRQLASTPCVEFGTFVNFQNVAEGDWNENEDISAKDVYSSELDAFLATFKVGQTREEVVQ